VTVTIAVLGRQGENWEREDRKIGEEERRRGY